MTVQSTTLTYQELNNWMITGKLPSYNTMLISQFFINSILFKDISTKFRKMLYVEGLVKFFIRTSGEISWYFWRNYLVLLEKSFGAFGEIIWCFWRNHLVLLKKLFGTSGEIVWYFWRNYLSSVSSWSGDGVQKIAFIINVLNLNFIGRNLHPSKTIGTGNNTE